MCRTYQLKWGGLHSFREEFFNYKNEIQVSNKRLWTRLGDASQDNDMSLRPAAVLLQYPGITVLSRQKRLLATTPALSPFVYRQRQSGTLRIVDTTAFDSFLV